MLRLSKEDQALYDAKLFNLNSQKEMAIRMQKPHYAKQVRQAIGRLYDEFSKKQLPEPEPEPKPEPECQDWDLDLNTEQRLDRIESHLKLGKYYSWEGN